MDIVALIISILAIFGSAFVYFQHDRKLKKQEAILNDLQVSEIEKAKEDRMKAIVRMDTQYESAGKGLLLLFNDGKAEARNVSWFFDKSFLLKIPQQGNYKRLVPGQEVSFDYLFLENPNPVGDVTLTWADDYSNNNSITITLHALNKAGNI